jgi:hypothetical protein
MSATQTLLASLIDYAGLFPPAGLPMEEAVRNYAAYRQGPHAALLHRFLVPSARLAEFAVTHARLPAGQRAGWEVGLLAGSDPATDATLFADVNRRAEGFRLVAVEGKAATPEEVARLSAAFPAEIPLWIEIPLSGDPVALLQAIKRAGRHAKIRTGGLTAEAFPSPADVVRFLTACLEARLEFKATSGLHHVLHGRYPFTYAPDSAHGPMIGFLNLFLAATLLHSGGLPHYALALLGDAEKSAFRITPEAVIWRGHPFPTAQLAAARRGFCRSFGSCSFTEPVEELHALRWL